MFKLIKWLSRLILTLIVLLIVAVFFIPKFFDPNDYRDEIITLAKKHTGRDLRLDGDLSVSVFPWLGVRTEKLSFSQPAEIGGDLIAVNSAQLRVKLMPLLGKRVEVDTVVLNEPELRIVTLKNGVDSFSGLAGSSVGDKKTSTESTDSAQSLDFVIEGLEINNALVVVDDRSKGERFEIHNFNLNTGNLIGGGLADVRVSGLAQSSSQEGDIDFNVTTLAQINVDTVDVLLVDLVFQASLTDNNVAVNIADLRYSQSQIAEISDLSIKWSGAQKAQINTDTISVDLNKQIAESSLVSISSSEIKAIVSDLLVTSIIDGPSIKGSLSVEPFNARNLMKDLQVDFEPSSSDVLKRVGLKTTFNATTESASLSDLNVILDQSNLTGSGSVVNFDQPRITFDLMLDQLNLDDYLPEDAVEKEGGDSTFDAEALKVPMDVFKDVDANGHFSAGALISGGLELNDIDVTIASSNGRVTITPKANLYDGKTDGVVSFAESAGVSTLKIDNEIDLVALGEMLTQADITDQLSGIGSLIVDMVVTEKNGIQSNEGTIKLVAKNGVLKGVDIQNIIQSGYSKYRDFKGRSLSDEEASEISGSSDETKFAELLGTFHVKDYKITNDDFSMKAPLFRVSGAGDILIDSQTLDYTVNFSVVNSIKGQGGEAFDTLKGLTIPIRLSGEISAPRYSVDWSSLYKSLAKQKVQEEKAKLLKDKLGIDGGESLSTKEVLKQLILKEVSKDNTETPVNEEDSETEPESVNQEKVEEDKKSTKDQLKDELKNKLLESLFN